MGTYKGSLANLNLRLQLEVDRRSGILAPVGLKFRQ